MTEKKVYSRKQIILFTSIVSFFGLFLVLMMGELFCRYLESQAVPKNSPPNMLHPILGWMPKPESSGTHETAEFKSRFTINSLGMNDDAISKTDSSKNRILALGDSHTFATGAGVDEVWPNALERMLYGEESPRSGAVYNSGVPGYNLGQYLLRMRILWDELHPQLVIIGFSMATDLYDLVPPEKGGFIYGKDKGRAYFDLDENGELKEIKELVGVNSIAAKAKEAGEDPTESKRDASIRLRNFLGQFALYRRLKRSSIAMWIATHWQVGDRSLWPGLDTALKKDLTEDDTYRWTLAEKIIHQIGNEAKNKNVKVVLVNIPYLAQVYDDVWESSFGTAPEKYDRWIAGKRLREICEKGGIYYIDTTDPMVNKVRNTGKWLHHPEDAHPTPEGHHVIAETIAVELRKQDLLVFDN